MGILLVILIAHNYWIFLDDFSPSKGETISCKITGGHNFPDGEVNVSEKLVRIVRVIKPDDGEDTIGKASSFSFIPKLEGTYTIVAELGPRKFREPRYILYAILPVGEKSSFQIPESLGKVLASEWPRVGQNIKVVFEKHGDITLLDSRGKKMHLKAKEFSFKPVKEGLFLIALEKRELI